ncbi:MAG TPA: cytochrome c-type biogenesis protein [Caulobacteraceae bacterium]
MRGFTFAVALAVVLLAGQARAVAPDEQLADPRLEARARAIGGELRCVVCQNQTIDDSDAELARDLRIILRERLTAGDSDKQAIDFIVERYGTFVLLKPPFESQTLLLWLGPLLVLAAGGAAAALYMRRRLLAARAEPALTQAERLELDRILTADDPR